MATIYVPEDYSTVTAAVAAMTDDDLISIDDGTYVEGAINVMANGAAIAARYPGAGVIFYNTTVYFNGTNNTIKGIRFAALSQYNIAVSAEYGILNVLDCVIDIPQDGSGVVNGNSGITVRRCVFTQAVGATSIGTAVYGGVDSTHVTSCLFDGLVSSYAVLVAANTGLATGAVTNCTFSACSAVVEAGAKLIDTYDAVGNILLNCAADTFGIYGVNDCDYNCSYGGTYGDGPWFYEGAGNILTDPELDASFVPSATSPCNDITGNYVTFDKARTSLNGVTFTKTAGSIGAMKYVAPVAAGTFTTLLSVNVNMGAGLISGGVACHEVIGTYDSPFSRAWAMSVAAAINPIDSIVIYDVVTNKYKSYGFYVNSPNTWATSGLALYFLGTGTAGGLYSDDLTFSADPLSYLFTSLANEEMLKYFVPGEVEYSSNGAVRGTINPVQLNSRLIAFELLSNKENVPSTVLMKILGQVKSGAGCRIYRDWPNTLSKWTTSNIDGYDDFIVTSAGEIRSTWLGPVANRYRINIEGMAYDR